MSSALALEALFDEGGRPFLDALLVSQEPGHFRHLATRWLEDRRPAMRGLLLEYIADGLQRPNHQPLVKALFKGAEKKQDHELMAHLMVACDRLARRERKTKTRWDWSTRQPIVDETVVIERSIPRGYAPTRNLPPVNGKAPKPPAKKIYDPRTGRRQNVQGAHLSGFTYRTRRYLQRRAWRYFRLLGKENPQLYRDTVSAALMLYEDHHLSEPLRLLDSWGLMHALYHHSPVVSADAIGWQVAPDKDLSQLAPAPAYPQVWQAEPGPLFDLAARARARTVRLFALATLRKYHPAAFKGVALVQVRRFLSSPHQEIQVLGAELLENAQGLEFLSVAEWMSLLALPNLAARPVVARLLEKHVSPQRMTDADLVALGRSVVAPAAQLGLRWLKARPVADEAALLLRLPLGEAPAANVRQEAVAWLLELIAAASFAKPEHLRELADARFADTRALALSALRQPRYAQNLALWQALSETPYDDVKATFLAHLDQLSVGLDTPELARIWAAVILSVHRGSRAKGRAARQLTALLLSKPEQAGALLPLLDHLLRSLRIPERRLALGAVAKLAVAVPALRASVSELLPKLRVEAP